MLSVTPSGYSNYLPLCGTSVMITLIFCMHDIFPTVIHTPTHRLRTNENNYLYNTCIEIISLNTIKKKKDFLIKFKQKWKPLKIEQFSRKQLSRVQMNTPMNWTNQMNTPISRPNEHTSNFQGLINISISIWSSVMMMMNRMKSISTFVAGML